MIWYMKTDMLLLYEIEQREPSSKPLHLCSMEQSWDCDDMRMTRFFILGWTIISVCVFECITVYRSSAGEWEGGRKIEREKKKIEGNPAAAHPWDLRPVCRCLFMTSMFTWDGFQEMRVCIPDSGRHTPVWPSYISCSRPKPLHQAHVGLPRCCCKKRPATLDTVDRCLQVLTT